MYSNFIAIFVSLEVKQDLNAIIAVCVLSDAGDGLHDRVGHRDSRLSRQATQSAASSISQQLDTPRCGPRKSFLTEAIMQIVRRSWRRTEKSSILRAQSGLAVVHYVIPVHLLYLEYALYECSMSIQL